MLMNYILYVLSCRCYAVLYPMKAMYVCSISKARRAVGVIWLLSLILATPALVVQVSISVHLMYLGVFIVSIYVFYV